jgi:hypothetical protein
MERGVMRGDIGPFQEQSLGIAVKPVRYPFRYVVLIVRSLG